MPAGEGGEDAARARPRRVDHQLLERRRRRRLLRLDVGDREVLGLARRHLHLAEVEALLRRAAARAALDDGAAPELHRRLDQRRVVGVVHAHHVLVGVPAAHLRAAHVRILGHRHLVEVLRRRRARQRARHLRPPVDAVAARARRDVHRARHADRDLLQRGGAAALAAEHDPRDELARAVGARLHQREDLPRRVVHRLRRVLVEGVDARLPAARRRLRHAAPRVVERRGERLRRLLLARARFRAARIARHRALRSSIHSLLPIGSLRDPAVCANARTSAASSSAAAASSSSSAKRRRRWPWRPRPRPRRPRRRRRRRRRPAAAGLPASFGAPTRLPRRWTTTPLRAPSGRRPPPLRCPSRRRRRRSPSRTST